MRKANIEKKKICVCIPPIIYYNNNTPADDCGFVDERILYGRGRDGFVATGNGEELLYVYSIIYAYSMYL